MTDEEIKQLETVVDMTMDVNCQYLVFFFDTHDGVLKRVRSIQHDHRDTPTRDDPKGDPCELPEPVAWLGDQWGRHCVSLWVTELTDFRIYTRLKWSFIASGTNSDDDGGDDKGADSHDEDGGG